MIDQLIQLEWEMFQQVKNAGGPASCQSDFPTFELMRRSQFLAWPQALQESYCADLLQAKEQGRNLVMEKYAYMMESTHPEEFEQLRPFLPEIEEAAHQIIERIISIQMIWREDFAKAYPHLSGQARLIHSSEDQSDDTSFETYLRGELKTYSKRTLTLYGQMTVSFCKENQNLTEQIMEHTVRAYGYDSLEAAERAYEAY